MKNHTEGIWNFTHPPVDGFSKILYGGVWILNGVALYNLYKLSVTETYFHSSSQTDINPLYFPFILHPVNMSKCQVWISNTLTCTDSNKHLKRTIFFCLSNTYCNIKVYDLIFQNNILHFASRTITPEIWISKFSLVKLFECTSNFCQLPVCSLLWKLLSF